MSSIKSMTKSIRRRARTGSSEYIRREIEATKWFLQYLERDSEFFEVTTPRDIPKFNPAEVVTGRLLGEGEFGRVNSVIAFNVDDQCHCQACKANSTSSSENQTTGQSSESEERRQTSSTPDANKRGDTSKVSFAEMATVIDNIADKLIVVQPGGGASVCSMLEDDEVSVAEEKEELDWVSKGIQGEQRGYMKAHPKRQEHWRYAMKRARPNIERQSRSTAALDLASEVKFLSHISHPNIVKLRGIVGVPGERDYAMVLDKMQMTLSDKIIAWQREENKPLLSRVSSLLRAKKKMTKDHFDRLEALYDVSRAIKYLHKHRIIFRDMKPDNIGYDVRGDYKLFDFGLARELLPKDLVKPPDGYKITGATGSRRYMAPENLLCMEYGLSADIYSFGILFWELCSLQTPFANYTADRHFTDVILNRKRPNLQSVSWLTPPLLLLVQECWSPVANDRPLAKRICQLLRAEMRMIGEQFGKTKALQDRSGRHMLDRSLRSMQGGGQSTDSGVIATMKVTPTLLVERSAEA